MVTLLVQDFSGHTPTMNLNGRYIQNDAKFTIKSKRQKAANSDNKILIQGSRSIFVNGPEYFRTDTLGHCFPKSGL